MDSQSKIADHWRVKRQEKNIAVHQLDKNTIAVDHVDAFA